ncbi:MAG: DUF3795 domain-containing protein [Thermodesulfobacteriota bacterium]|jgi:hypothetical protein
MKLSFCGNDCDECPRYLATKSVDEKVLQETAVLWHRLGYSDRVVSQEEITCQGCTSSNWCRYEIAKCAEKKQVGNCGKCQFYPCPTILETFKRTEVFAKGSKATCSQEDYVRLQKAFFLKKENLDKIYNERRKIKTTDEPAK